MIYTFKNNKYNADPQKVAEELERIRIENGQQLRTKDVVVQASAEDSPLHPCFTWDDTAAAHKYRMHEARELIRSIVVLKNETDKPTPVYWNVIIKKTENATAEQFYQNTTVLMKRPEEYASALRGILGDLTAAQAGLEQLRALAPKKDRSKVSSASDHISSARQRLDEIAPG
jgi:hypothetical protein